MSTKKPSDKELSSESQPGAELQFETNSQLDLSDPSLTEFDLVKEGARRDGVEIVHYRPRFDPEQLKSRIEKRIERTIALCFLLTGLASVAFIAVFGFWHWHYKQGAGADKWFTPLLGTSMAVALLGIGVGLIIWNKKLMPEELSIQDRHDGASDPDERELTAATLTNLAADTGITRRPLLKGAVALGLAPVGLMAVAPLGALLKNPKRELFKTGFKKGVRLVRLDGSPIRPDDISAGGIETVFPGIPGGATNKHADSPTLLIHLRESDAKKVKPRKRNIGDNYGSFYAYSKICTHAGCPASLYEQQTQRLLCPCHQSQFDVLQGCKPIFGPASRALPALPIELDDEGYFVARSDYKEAIGPAFWERP
ncbi:MAG TPA: ubiquinol-cytochrome c reductase iron-sulfur subunit [Mycobacteriales bacterium]|nr:ubiquinol-cytochrome c reductase iron-sulfur subunit [Mycobacteriales bacterium]